MMEFLTDYPKTPTQRQTDARHSIRRGLSKPRTKHDEARIAAAQRKRLRRQVGSN